MTRMEKFANNMLAIVIARAAMIVTPLLLSFFMWLGWQVWTGLEARIAALEAGATAQRSCIQDHESRLVFGLRQGETFESSVKAQFAEVNAAIKALSAEMNTMNGAIIRVQTTIENRLPPRTGSLEMRP